MNKNDNDNDEISLRQFLSILKDKNELLIIEKKIKKKFQLASIVGKFDKREAILFTNIEDSKFKVASNILGTRERFYYGIQPDKEKKRTEFSNFSSINKENYPTRISSDAHFYKNN